MRRRSSIILIIFILIVLLPRVNLKAEDASKYVLRTDSEVHTFSRAILLAKYMQDSRNFDKTKSYTLELNDDLELPLDYYGKPIALYLQGKITVKGNGFTLSSGVSNNEGGRLVKLSSGKIIIQDLKLDGSLAHSGIRADNLDKNSIINLSLKNCYFKNFIEMDPKYQGFGMGAAIYARNTSVDMNGCKFENCEASYNAGGLYYCISTDDFSNNTLKINDCHFEACHVRNGNGGAFYYEANTRKNEVQEEVLIKNSSFKNCTASISGGAMSMNGNAKFTIYNTPISDCSAISQGGAMWTSVRKLKLKSSYIKNCKVTERAFSHGGAIFTSGSYGEEPYDVIMSDYKISGCSSDSEGGALFFGRNKYKIYNTEITNCSSATGGAISSSSAEGYIHDSKFYENDATGGGAISVYGNGYYKNKIEIERCSFERNTARYGGAMEVQGSEDGVYKLKDVKITNNTANDSEYIIGNGGAFALRLPNNIRHFTIEGGEISNNYASNLGGAFVAIVNYQDERVKDLSKILHISSSTIIKENKAGSGYYNPPNDLDYFRRKGNSRPDYLIKYKDGKWKNIDGLLNNYDIDYINKITTTAYDQNCCSREIYAEKEDTRGYSLNEDYEERGVREREVRIKSYEDTGLPKTNKIFKGWSMNKDGTGKLYKGGEYLRLKGNLYLYAIWEKPPITHTTLTLDENYRGGKITEKDVMPGDTIEPYLYKPKRRGFTFKGWSYNKKRLDKVHYDDRIYEPTTVYAIWDEVEEEPEEIKGMTHKAYIFGYPDGTVRPNGKITRAEAAAMLARLLEIESIGSADKPSFPDTPSSWYNKAINASVQRGIMKGYPDGTFKPNDAITRAEFTQMIATIDNKAYGVAPFADVVGHWAERPIGSEYQAGRILGYPDGTFRPDNHITRCEAAVILNKIFERNFDNMSLIKCKNPQMIKYFIDLDASFWGYNELVEATNTHEYIRRNTNRVEEDWLLIK